MPAKELNSSTRCACVCCGASESWAAEEGKHLAPQERVHDDSTEDRTQSADAVRTWRTSHQLWRLLFARAMRAFFFCRAILCIRRLCNYCTLGPVSAWMGDRLWTGKPPWRRTRHPGLLSLSPPSVAGWNEYPAKAEGVNRHIAWYTSPYPWSHSVRWCLAVGLAFGDERWSMWSGSALDVLRDDAIYKYTFTLLSLLNHR